MLDCLIAFLLTLPLAWEPLRSPTTSSLRGVAVSPDGTICVTGSGPEVWISDDQGQTWSSRTPVQAGVTDYRCAAYPASDVLLIASAGTPAVIVRSEDAGQSWTLSHQDDRQGAFFDSVRFFDRRHGLAFGDPVSGRFSILGTRDGGRTWTDVNCPVDAIGDEAGFAASNQSIALWGQSKIAIGLGGQTGLPSSRILRSNDRGQTWNVIGVGPMPTNASSGIFAVCAGPRGSLVAVGGDYQQAHRTEGNIARSDDSGASWRPIKGRAPSGFRSSLIFVDGDQPTPESIRAGDYWLTTGPSGTDVSADGDDWLPLGQIGFHALARLADGTPIAVGSEGRMAVLRPGPLKRPSP